MIAKVREQPPLMRLPPELRCNIYELILGGRTIHVGWPTGGFDTTNLTVSECKAQVLDADFASVLRHFLAGAKDDKTLAHIADDYQKTWFVYRHRLCGSTVKDRQLRKQGLNILLTCKEVYREAATTAFESNTFTFRHPDTMEKFLKMLSTVQRGAIRNILLYSTNATRMWTPMPPAVTTLFPQRCNLTVIIELCRSDLRDMRDVSKRQSIVAGMSGLASCKMRSVKVCIIDNSRRREKESNVADEFNWEVAPARLDEWADQITKMLRNPMSDPAVDTESDDVKAERGR